LIDNIDIAYSEIIPSRNVMFYPLFATSFAFTSSYDKSVTGAPLSDVVSM